jgi:hypothetical protein
MSFTITGLQGFPNNSWITDLLLRMTKSDYQIYHGIGIANRTQPCREQIPQNFSKVKLLP